MPTTWTGYPEPWRDAVGEVWVSPLPSPLHEAQAVAAEVAPLGARTRTPPVGEHGAIGAITWEVLGPIPATGAAAPDAGAVGSPESATENDASLVIRLTVAGVRILLTGDVEPVAAGEDLGQRRRPVGRHPEGAASRVGPPEPGLHRRRRSRVAVAMRAPAMTTDIRRRGRWACCSRWA